MQKTHKTTKVVKTLINENGQITETVEKFENDVLVKKTIRQKPIKKGTK